MASITLGGSTVHTSGELPQVGERVPAFTVTTPELRPLSSDELTGQRLVLNIFPSVDTGVCAASVRAFNERAVGLDDVVVLNLSADLPFAQKRFCGAEGIDRVRMGSVFRNREVLRDLGVEIVDGSFATLAARAVLVLDADGTVLHRQLVPDISSEPDYDAALAVL